MDLKGAADHDGDTSYLVVVDKHRNVVSFEPSLHNGFGTNVVMGRLGFSFNCRGVYFSLVPGHANALEPFKRPRSTLQSTLVLKDGKPIFALGSPGGDEQCQRTIQTLLNLVHFGLNIQQAIKRLAGQRVVFRRRHFLKPPCIRAISRSKTRIPENTRAELAAKGHKLRVVGGWSLGMSAGIAINPETGVLTPAAIRESMPTLPPGNLLRSPGDGCFIWLS